MVHVSTPTNAPPTVAQLVASSRRRLVTVVSTTEQERSIAKERIETAREGPHSPLHHSLAVRLWAYRLMSLNVGSALVKWVIQLSQKVFVMKKIAGKKQLAKDKCSIKFTPLLIK